MNKTIWIKIKYGLFELRQWFRVNKFRISFDLSQNSCALRWNSTKATRIKWFVIRFIISFWSVDDNVFQLIFSVTEFEMRIVIGCGNEHSHIINVKIGTHCSVNLLREVECTKDEAFCAFCWVSPKPFHACSEWSGKCFQEIFITNLVISFVYWKCWWKPINNTLLVPKAKIKLLTVDVDVL